MSPKAIAGAIGALVLLIWFQQVGYRTYRDLFVAKIGLAEAQRTHGEREVEVENLNMQVEEFLVSPEPTLKNARENLGLHPPDQVIIKVPGKR